MLGRIDMDEETKSLLHEAVRLLRIIARPSLVELRERFEGQMLASKKRREMWSEMDGSRSLADIARKVSVSHEAVRLFVSELEARWPDVVEVRRSGKSMYPRKLL